MERELRTGRLVMMIEPSLIRRIDDWRRDRHIDSRADAVRRLVGVGLGDANESPAGTAIPPGHDQNQNPATDRGNDERE